jgi:hypothetical protein
MTDIQLKTQLGRFIFFSSFALFLLLILFYLLAGLDTNDLMELLRILGPVKAVYMAGFLKYVIANKSNPEATQVGKPLSSLYQIVAKQVIYCHFSILIILITLYAFFNIIEFDSLKTTIACIEAFFGAYLGMVLTSLFDQPTA